MVISPRYTFKGSFLRPYVRVCRQPDRSTPASSAMYLGKTVQSAPVSRINLNGQNPSFVKTSMIMVGSGTSPKVMRFLLRGNSIDTNMIFRGDTADNDIFRRGDVFFLELGEQRSHRRSAGNDFVFALSNELTAEFFLQLNMSFGIHACYLQNEYYHAGEDKSSGSSAIQSDLALFRALAA